MILALKRLLAGEERRYKFVQSRSGSFDVYVRRWWGWRFVGTRMLLHRAGALAYAHAHEENAIWNDGPMDGFALLAAWDKRNER